MSIFDYCSIGLLLQFHCLNIFTSVHIMASNNASVLSWMKKNYDDLGENCWVSYDLNDEAILRPFAKDLPQRLKMEKQENYVNVLRELGLTEMADSNGKKALLNNVPIKTKNSKKEVNMLITRLNKTKDSFFPSTRTNPTKSSKFS